jgi:hypothetical protein
MDKDEFEQMERDEQRLLEKREHERRVEDTILQREIELDELRLKIALNKFTKSRKSEDRWTGQHDTEEWGETRDNIPDWPRDIAAAFELVEEMRSDPGITYVYIHACGNGRVMPGKEFYVELSSGQAGNGATLPVAISQVYLAYREATQPAAQP